MAFTQKLDPHRQEEVRGELGSYLGAHPHPLLRGGAMFLGAGFEVYSLSLSGISRSIQGANLASSLVRTGNWQHQILQQGKSQAIAFSSSRGDIANSTRVTGVVVAPLAAKIDQAIKWIDRERPSDRTEVFFFVVPAFQLQAFLLRDFSREDVLVVSNLARSGSVEECVAYDVREFLTELHEAKPIRGIVVKT
jgi:hypothetical protein